MQVQVSLSIEISATANLTEMEEQIQVAGQQAMREALKQAIRQREEQTPCCPHCGHEPHRLEGTVRRTIATTFGRVEVARRRFRCQGCWHRWCPANQLFTELKGGIISQPLQEAATLAGCSWPYRVASGLLKRLSGAQISAEEMRLLTNRAGKQRATQQQEEAERACSSAAQQAPSAEKSEQPMLVGLDGGWVGSREQRGGMEGKVAVICSRMEDLPMPTYSTTFSWSQRGPRHPPTTTASAGGAALGGDVWSIAAAGPPGQSGRTDAWWRPLAAGSGPSRRDQVDQAGTSTALPTGDLYSGLGASVAGS